MTDLICFSHLRWDFVWQRPQHLLSRLATGYRVLFVEEPIASTDLPEPRLEVKQYQCAAAEVTVARLLYPLSPERWIGHGDPLTQETYNRLLREHLHAEHYREPILWLYTPMALDFAKTIPHSLLVVDVMDQLAAFKGAPVELIKHEQSALKRADVVFTGGVSLYRDKLPFNVNTHLFPSGVDVKHFGKAQAPNRLPVPQDIAHLQGPTLGYYGVIDERMDLELIASLAHTHPEWNIVLIGPVAKIDHNDLPHASNIHYTGMKGYAELPSYLARFDVALIPFALNDSTRFVSPTKTLEYMAAHKPIVSTPINDVIELYGSVVHIGRDPVDFERQVQVALAEPSGERRRKENRLLRLYTWDSIAFRMKQIIERHTLAPSYTTLAGSLRQPDKLPLLHNETAAASGDR